MRGLVATVDRFRTVGSPLEGKVVPRDWRRLDVVGKRGALVGVGYARDYRAAAVLLGKHGAAVKAGRAQMVQMARHRTEAVADMWWNK